MLLELFLFQGCQDGLDPLGRVRYMKRGGIPSSLFVDKIDHHQGLMGFFAPVADIMINLQYLIAVDFKLYTAGTPAPEIKSVLRQDQKAIASPDRPIVGTGAQVDNPEAGDDDVFFSNLFLYPALVLSAYEGDKGQNSKKYESDQ